MMKKLLISTVALVATAALVQAGPKFSQPVKQISEPMVQAVGAWYVGGYGGASFWQTDFTKGGNGETHKIGWTAGAKVGFDFDPAAPVRLALELDGMFNGFNRNMEGTFRGELTNIGSGNSKVRFNMQSFTLALNALAKFDCGVFQPYVGAGAGFYTLHMEAKMGSMKHTERTNGFAWQLLAGSDYKLDANWALFAEYKWLNYERAFEKVPGVNRAIRQQLVNVGVRYQL